jgi:outer membrane protein OmpA-like peptidoglycan-associated protein
MKFVITSFALAGLIYGQPAQAPNPVKQIETSPGSRTPIYRITVVSRNTKAINYRHRSRSTLVDFRGTALMPEAKGQARVDSKQGVIKIDAQMDHLKPASQFGPEYLTYVLWAVTPEGRATNVGEILLDGDKSKISATTELQAFGMIVTAEPYFAVTQPSDVVVMENFVRKDTQGSIQEIDAKYELLPRGQYTLNVAPSDLKPVRLDPKVPLELLEARNAVQIARYAGADQYAGETFRKASQELENGERMLRKSSKKSVQTVAREAVQSAEDARIIAVKKIADEQLANERQAAADREAQAKAAAEAEAQKRQLAEAAQKTEAAERARAEAERQAAVAATEQARADAERAKREAAAQQAAAQTEIDRVTREKAELEAARANADAERQAAVAATERANAATEEANQLRQKAEADRTELRAELMRQFNLILETRDTARGLIVNMSDVLFDTGKSTLRPGAREKLAKVSGIIQSHPGLKLEVEGHTDSVGGDEYNQQLSEKRAEAVRAYLVQQGIPADSITAKGYGKSRPVVSNATAEGRQRNRRVEMVVSGDIIGNSVESARASQ